MKRSPAAVYEADNAKASSSGSLLPLVLMLVPMLVPMVVSVLQAKFDIPNFQGCIPADTL